MLAAMTCLAAPSEAIEMPLAPGSSVTVSSSPVSFTSPLSYRDPSTRVDAVEYAEERNDFNDGLND